MNGDFGDAPGDAGSTSAAAYYRRYYNLRSNGPASPPASPHAPGLEQLEGRRKQPGGGAACAAPGHDGHGLDGGPAEGPAGAAGVPLRRVVLALALAATVVLALGMAGMYANVCGLHRGLRALSDAVDATRGKMAEMEALVGQLYELLNRAEVRLREEMEILLQKEMWLRDNDKTGLIDFALESAGGRIVDTGGTPRYDAEDSTLSYLGIPLYQITRSNADNMLRPDMSPGSCWAFRGGRGVAVVSLLGLVRVSAVSLEHIPASQAPTGTTLSAPKAFAVLALRGPRLDDQAVELGRFVYRKDGHALQIFRIPERPAQSIRYVALRIDSNHGHPEFTCVYRFRVHGSLDHQEGDDNSLGDKLLAPTGPRASARGGV